MEPGNLYVHCTRCTNRCRVRLTVDSDGVITEARKQVLGRHTTYEQCPNLDQDVGLTFEYALVAHTKPC